MKIEVRNATKIIKGVKVLDDISMTMESGGVYGFRGRNGSGKTMLMRAICGLIHLTQGEILIDGKVIGRELSFPPSVGLLLENPAFLDEYSGFDNLKLIASVNKLVTDGEIRDILKEVGLDPNDRKKYKKYSLGMKQRLGIACAFMEKPQLVILDEPTNALDEEGVQLVSALLSHRMTPDTLIILSDHNANELEAWTDNIFALTSGRLEA